MSNYQSSEDIKQEIEALQEKLKNIEKLEKTDVLKRIVSEIDDKDLETTIRSVESWLAGVRPQQRIGPVVDDDVEPVKPNRTVRTDMAQMIIQNGGSVLREKLISQNSEKKPLTPIQKQSRVRGYEWGTYKGYLVTSKEGLVSFTENGKEEFLF